VKENTRAFSKTLGYGCKLLIILSKGVDVINKVMVVIYRSSERAYLCILRLF
jgi:hypothetical protein